jgi:thymidylate kinase
VIITIGFEGPNRVGKGTQISLLSHYLFYRKIPFLVIRGDGSRPATGSVGDPFSFWWSEMNKKLRTTARLSDWDLASYRLAREMVVWRNRILLRMIRRANKEFGCLLIDRSIISRSHITREAGNLDVEDLYAHYVLKRRKITYETLCPDVIFILTAPKDVLRARLDQNDPKYDFRKLLIETKSDWYKDISIFPEQIQHRIIRVDSTRPPDLVANKILALLHERFSIFNSY